MSRPRHGEIWWADLEPTRGAEMNKTRPVVVMSADTMGVLSIKLIAPVTGRSQSQATHPWLVQVGATNANGLKKDGCVDVMQLRGIAIERFTSRIGRLAEDDLEEVLAAVALVMDIN